MPTFFLVLIIVLAPFYIWAAHTKDERRNALVDACQADGYTRNDCREHFKNYRPLPAKTGE